MKEDWQEHCKVLYTGKGKPFAVVRNDKIIEADTVEELIEAIRLDARVSRGVQVWITRKGRHIPINGGKMPDGTHYVPKVGSTITVKGSHKRSGYATYTVVNAVMFKKAVVSAKATVDKSKSWRVDDTHTVKDFRHDKLFKTNKGSTIAVTPDGDIISVCRHKGDNATGADLLQFAVKQGGKKLDSFDGNYKFYVDNGFEPVSWTPFNKEYAPHDWKEDKHKEEPVIFFKYTGRVTKMSKEQFYKSVKPCTGENGYDDAMNIRDNSMR